MSARARRLIAAGLLALALAGCGGAPSGGTCPSDRPIKGNDTSVTGERIYHMPGQEYYSRTIPERCFATEDEARRAGYRRSLR